MNTGAEYGFGGIIAALPGFKMVSGGISQTFTDPLVNGAVTTTALAGITGSASGGMGIALSTMSAAYTEAINTFHIPPEVMHRVISMASGGWTLFRIMAPSLRARGHRVDSPPILQGYLCHYRH